MIYYNSGEVYLTFTISESYTSDSFLNSFQDTMGSTIKDSTPYQVLEEHIRKIDDGKNRFVPIEERRDTGILGSDVLMSICRGNMINSYLKLS